MALALNPHTPPLGQLTGTCWKLYRTMWGECGELVIDGKI
jgi:hypothetical protein